MEKRILPRIIRCISHSLVIYEFSLTNEAVNAIVLAMSEYISQHQTRSICVATILGLVVLGLISWVTLVVILFVFGPPILIGLSLYYDSWQEERVIRWTGRPSPPPKYTFGIGQTNRLLNPDYLAWMMEGEQQSNAPLINPEYFQWMLENNKKPRGDYDGFL